MRSHNVGELSSSTVLPFGPVSGISRYVGVLERVQGENINLYCGAGVGGGSLVYGGFLVTPREAPFTRIFPAARARSASSGLARVR